MSNPSDRWIYRYTSLSSALDIVTNNRLTLLKPETWADGNDTDYLDSYKTAKSLRTLSALCFTSAFETSQHWNLFAPGIDGVRIRLERAALERDVMVHPGAVLRKVIYRKIDEVELTRDDVNDWPFVKRYPYEGEAEIRLLFESKKALSNLKTIDLAPTTSFRITLSPSLPMPLVPVVKNAFKAAAGSRVIKVSRSTLFGNSRWMNPIRERAKSLSAAALDRG